MSSEFVIDKNIDQLFENLPVGSIRKAIGNNLYGINFRQTPAAIPSARDTFGFTFFTRPQFNLTLANVSIYRPFYSLLTTNATSYQRYLRLMLDPRLSLNDGLKSPFVDSYNPFIPILTNNITSLSGWPDLVIPTYTSPSGLYGEEHSMVDGVVNHFENFDVDASFRNTRGSPILYMFYIWLKYQTLVFEGILTPYLDFITENELDYNTRIYRVVLDHRKKFVTFIAATGASFPLNVPTGNIFDFNVDTPFNNSNSTINVRFRCNGFTAFEDILKKEFNETGAIFNADIRKILEHDLENSGNEASAREDENVIYRNINGSSLVKIPYSLAMMSSASVTNNKFYNLNYRAYPYINLYTNELEWWTYESRFGEATSRSFIESLENEGIQSDLFEFEGE